MLTEQKTAYTYVGDTLVSQKTGSEVINFAYTNSGAPYGFTYNGSSYFYLLNLQGDVIGIYDSTGTVVVKYAYDAWGKLISTTGSMASTVGIKNPIRYRGYYYDTETKLYYLQSRYYDPETCRFINADSLLIAGDYIQGTNMFAYCLNNPVMYVDPTGRANEELAADIVMVFACLLYIADYAEKNNLDIAAFEDYYKRRLENASSFKEVKEHLLLGIDIMTGAASGLQSAYSNVGTLADVLKVMGKNIPNSLSDVLSGMEIPFQIWLDFNNPLVYNLDIALSVLEIIADWYGSTIISSAAVAVATSVATVNPILGAAMGVTVLIAGDALWEEIKSPGTI